MRKGVRARDFRCGDAKGDINKVIRFKSARARRLKAFHPKRFSVEQLTVCLCKDNIFKQTILDFGEFRNDFIF